MRLIRLQPLTCFRLKRAMENGIRACVSGTQKNQRQKTRCGENCAPNTSLDRSHDSFLTVLFGWMSAAFNLGRCLYCAGTEKLIVDEFLTTPCCSQKPYYATATTPVCAGVLHG